MDLRPVTSGYPALNLAFSRSLFPQSQITNQKSKIKNPRCPCATTLIHTSRGVYSRYSRYNVGPQPPAGIPSRYIAVTLPVQPSLQPLQTRYRPIYIWRGEVPEPQTLPRPIRAANRPP